MSAARKIENYCKALAKLEQFTATPAEDERDRAGIIQAFEFTFEQAWKVCQAVGVEQGFNSSSPREALKIALSIGIINQEDEDTWLQMLKDRNSTSHLYNEKTANEICERTLRNYLALFRATREKLLNIKN